MLDFRINMIKCVFSPGCTLDVLVKFGENSLEACFVKVPSNDACHPDEPPVVYIP